PEAFTAKVRFTPVSGHLTGEMWALETGILVFERPLWSKKAKCLKRVVNSLLENSHIRVSCNTAFDH
ncbi:MAG: hypothetical protein LJE58_16770, partial [Thiogranum sp.]|nr:hypothetical protein [Thiogranum sp.]